MPFGAFAAPDIMIRHPFGRIPVMDHGDFRLYEMQAILRYLARIIPEPSLTLRDPRAEARMNSDLRHHRLVFHAAGFGADNISAPCRPAC